MTNTEYKNEISRLEDKLYCCDVHANKNGFLKHAWVCLANITFERIEDLITQRDAYLSQLETQQAIDRLRGK